MDKNWAKNQSNANLGFPYFQSKNKRPVVIHILPMIPILTQSNINLDQNWIGVLLVKLNV